MDVKGITAIVLVTIVILAGLITSIILVQRGEDEKQDEQLNGLEPSPEIRDAMESIGRRYDRLVNESPSLEEATEKLIEELNGDHDLVEEAVLYDDGYTVSIRFREGTVINMIYDDGLFPGEEVTRSSGSNKISLFSSGATGYQSFGNIPSRNKIMIISAASLTNTRDSNRIVRGFEDLFTDLGWNNSDIRVLSRENSTDMNIIVDDLLDLRGYGLVIYIGHGGYLLGTPVGRHYLQCCNVGLKEPFVKKERLLEYIEWGEKEQLILYYCKMESTGEWNWEVYMDTSLYETEGKSDPGTIFMTISCNSWRFSDQCMKMGLGSFHGWDNRATGPESLEIYSNLISDMSVEDEQKTDKDTHSSTPKAELTQSTDGQLQISTIGDGYYLPAWGNLTMVPSSPVSGASDYEVEFPTKDGDHSILIKNGNTKEMGLMTPKDRYMTVRARDGKGDLLDVGVNWVDIECGYNEVEISDWQPFGIVLEAEPEKAAADGIDKSTITAIVRIWKPNDVLVPTGDPIPFKNITFHSSLGSFMGTEIIRTDANGEAIIELTSDDPGTANLKAFIEKDGMESTGVCSVKFGGSGGITLDAEKVLLDYSPERISPDSSVITATVTDGSGNPMTETDVYFSTNFGRIVGHNPATTDSKGEAKIKIEVDPYSFSPNPTNMKFAYTGYVSVSFDEETEEDSIEFNIDAREWVNVVFSGSETSREMRDPNATFQAEDINIQMALDNSSDWRTIWRSSGSVSHSPGNYYPFDMKTIKRSSVMYLFFEYTGGSSISTTYIHMYNSWMDEVQEVPSFSGNSGDPKGEFNFTIP